MTLDVATSVIEDKIAEILAASPVAGLSLVIVDEKDILYSEGFGLANIEGENPFTDKTLVQIGSVSKSFTATSVGLIVQEGHFGWDDSVQEIYPRFRVSDKAVGSRITFRDLLSHRTGLPRHDFLWYKGHFQMEEFFNQLPHLRFAVDLRQKFLYNNLMYDTCAKIVSDVSGLSFAQFHKEKIFSPLGMNESHRDLVVDHKIDSYATPYLVREDKPVKTKYFVQEYPSGAGGVVSNALEMGNWLVMNLSGGLLNEEQLFPSEVIREIQKPQILVGEVGLSSFVPELNHSLMPGYALGWGTEVYRGNRFVQHGGYIDGFASIAGFLPDQKLGIGIFANTDCNLLINGLMLWIIDSILKLDPVDWVEQALSRSTKAWQANDASKETLLNNRVKGTSPTFSLTDYCGCFHNPAYGTFEVRLVDQSLEATLGRFVSKLEHYHYNTFLFSVEHINYHELLHFVVNRRAQVEKLELTLDNELSPEVFVKQPDKKFSTSDYLDQFCGVYDYLGKPLEIKRTKGKLVAYTTVGTQISLVPVSEDLFEHEQVKAVKYSFKRDSGGIVIQLIIEALGGVVIAEKTEN